MTIAKKLIPVSIGTAALDTGTDPKLVSQGVTRLENASYRRKGAIGHAYGLNQVHNTSFANGNIAAYKGRPLIWKNGEQRIWDGYDFVALHSDIRTFDCETTKIQALADPVVLQQSSAEFGNIRAVIWIEGTGGITHRIATYEIDSGLQLQNVSLGYVYTLSLIGMIATTTSLLYFFVDADGDLRRGSINTTTGDINLATKISATWPRVKATPYSKVFDVCTYDDKSGVALAWVGSGGISDGYAIWGTLDSSGYNDDYNWRVAEDCKGVGIFDFGSSKYGMAFWDSQSSGTDFYLYGIVGSAGAVFETGNMELWNWTDVNITISGPPMGVRGTNDKVWVYVNVLDANYAYPEYAADVRCNWYDAEGSTGAIDQWHEGITIACKPWVDRDTTDRHYMVVIPYMATPGDQAQITFTVVGRIEDGLPKYLGKFLVGAAIAPWPSAVVDISVEGTEVYRTVVTSQLNNYTMAIAVADIREPVTADMVAIETLNHLVFPGSISYVWDGQELTEQSFLLWPYRLDTAQKSGTGLDTPSTYGYVATYEWYDSSGHRWQSAPSPVISHKTNTGFGQVTVRVPPLTMFDPYKENIQIVLWRTDGYGTEYRRVANLDNGRYAGYIEFTDTMSDDSLASKELLYTQPPGDILEDVCPPPARIACRHQNRLFVANREREDIEIQYTKEFEYGNGVKHSDFLTISVPSQDGQIMAMATFMDRLIIFKRDSIWYSYGNGLTAAGTGTGYTAPQLLHPSIGCVAQKTVAEIPSGLMFLGSNNKIHIISRSMTISCIGDPVSYYTQNHTPISAVPLASCNEVVFASMTAASTVVYNWEFGLWSVWSEWSGNDCTLAKTRPLAASNESGGDEVLWMVRADGSVAHQMPGLFGGWLAGVYKTPPEPITIETGWFPFVSIGGFQRLRRIVITGQMPTLHRLGVKIAYDFEPSWVDDITVDVATDIAKPFGYEQFLDGTNDASLQDKGYIIEVTGSRQKCTAVRLQLRDIAPEPTNGTFTVADCGFEVSAVTFEVGAKTGPFRPGEGRHTT
jgi:hypothetical protein